MLLSGGHWDEILSQKRACGLNYVSLGVLQEKKSERESERD